jgi:hypothetical protein
MLEIPQEINDKISDINMEIEAIKHTFVSTTQQQRDSFKPFLVLFSDKDTKSFIITSRPIHDVNDYYTAISEMMFAYSANESTAMLFALDASKEINGVTQDLLEIYMACDEYCTVFSMPYTFNANNNFEWIEDSFEVFTLDRLEKAYDTSGHLHATLEIFEVLYLHTHMDVQYFDIVKLKSFFDANNFNYAHLKEDSTKQTPVSL